MPGGPGGPMPAGPGGPMTGGLGGPMPGGPGGFPFGGRGGRRGGGRSRHGAHRCSSSAAMQMSQYLSPQHIRRALTKMIARCCPIPVWQPTGSHTWSAELLHSSTL
ncbi:hypothetical protein OSTOST_03241 [Ostertagia ostertagi]